MPDNRETDIQFIRKVLIALGLTTLFALSVAFAILTFKVILVIFAGAVVAVPISWLSDFLNRKARIPRVLALVLVTLSLLAVIALILLPAIPLLVDQAVRLFKSLPEAIQKIHTLTERFVWAAPVSEALKDPFDTLKGSDFNWTKLFTGATGLFSDTMSVIAYPLIVLLIAVYLAADPELYINGFLKLFPGNKRERIGGVIDELGYTLRWWLFGQSISMTILGISTTLFLWFLDIPLAFFLGILTAIMTFIPNIGPIIAGVPTVLVSLTEGPLKAIIVLVFYVILQNVEGALITPNIHRRIIALPPVLIISGQVLLSTLVGPIGVILAMPLVAVGLVLVQRLYIEDVIENHTENSG